MNVGIYPLIAKSAVLFLLFDHGGTLESWGHGLKDGKHFIFHGVFIILYYLYNRELIHGMSTLSTVSICVDFVTTVITHNIW